MSSLRSPSQGPAMNLLLKNHHRAFRDARSQLGKTPLSTFMTSLIIALTLLFTSILLTGLNAFQHAAEKIHQNHQVTIYLKSEKKGEALTQWLAALKEHPSVKEVVYISPDEALAELTKQSDYQGILTGVEKNPLPPVVLIKFVPDENPQTIETLTTEWKAASWVDTLQFNLLSFKRMFALLTLCHQIIYTLAGLFGVGVLLMINHVIQAATQRNHREMTLLQLLGAPRAYVRRPFLYLGVLIGLIAGILVALLAASLLFSIHKPLQELLHSYNLAYSLSKLTLGIAFWSTLFSCFLGWLGAWMAFFKYSRQL